MVKLLLSKVYNSQWKFSDSLSIIYSLIFLPKNTFISLSIKIINKGKIKANSPFFFGISSNKVGLDPGAKGMLDISSKGVFKLGRDVRIARACKLYIDSEFEIGDNTYIQPNALILTKAGSCIGSDCAIGWNFQMLDHDLHEITGANGIKKNTAQIKIGNHVWIGSNVTVLKGVHIGDNCIIGSGSVITKSIPANSMAAGNPAVILKTAVSWN